MLGGAEGHVQGWLGQILCNLAPHTEALEVLRKLRNRHKAEGLYGVMPVLLRNNKTP